MRAVVVHAFGPPEVLEMAEMAEPQAGPGEVVVKVKTAGVMPVDSLMRSGRSPAGITLRLPLIPGNEFAGVVHQAGAEVKGFSIGDEVLGFTTLGGYAEYVAVSAEQIVHKPVNMPWIAAGGFSGNGQGAHMALSALRIASGDTVLIHGAAGGLGSFAVQLAKAWGASTVIGTASEDNHDYLRSLGAVPVAYGEGLEEAVRAAAPLGVDTAFVAAGSAEAVQASAALVPDRSRIRTMLPHPLNASYRIPALEGIRTAARLRELAGLYADGKVVIPIRAVYSLEQAVLAHRSIQSGHGSGKIVITIDSV